MKDNAVSRSNPLLVLLKAMLGFVAGGIGGAVIVVVPAGIWFFFIYPRFHYVSWDELGPGAFVIPFIAAPFGAIVGAALGTVLAARWRRRSKSL